VRRTWKATDRGDPDRLYTFDFQWKAWGKTLRRMALEQDELSERTVGRVCAADEGPGHQARRNHETSDSSRLGAGTLCDGARFLGEGRAPTTTTSRGSPQTIWTSRFRSAGSGFGSIAIPSFDSGIVGWWNDEADAWDRPGRACTWRGRCTMDSGHTKDQVRVWTNNRNFFSGANATPTRLVRRYRIRIRGHAQQRERLLCSVNVGQARWEWIRAASTIVPILPERN